MGKLQMSASAVWISVPHIQTDLTDREAQIIGLESEKISPTDCHRYACIWGEAFTVEQKLDFISSLEKSQENSEWRLSGKAGYKTAKCENDYKWQLMWESTNQKWFPVSRLYSVITWLHPIQIVFQTKGW